MGRVHVSKVGYLSINTELSGQRAAGAWSRSVRDSPPDCAESRFFKKLMEELMAAATAPGTRYMHQWRKGDVVMGDNRATMHHGRPWPMPLANVNSFTSVPSPASQLRRSQTKQFVEATHRRAQSRRMADRRFFNFATGHDRSLKSYRHPNTGEESPSAQKPYQVLEIDRGVKKSSDFVSAFVMTMPSDHLSCTVGQTGVNRGRYSA
jgi:hypothetical protein